MKYPLTGPWRGDLYLNLDEHVKDLKLPEKRILPRPVPKMHWSAIFYATAVHSLNMSKYFQRHESKICLCLLGTMNEWEQVAQPLTVFLMTV